MPDPAPLRMTLDEFLVWNDGTDVRYELIDGVVVPRRIPPPVHGALVVNLATAVHAGLIRPERILMTVGIRPLDRVNTYYLADVAVSAEPIGLEGYWLNEPIVVAEVLSPWADAHDRGKVDAYRRIPTVHDILLLHSTARRLEHWYRDPSAGWSVRDLANGGFARLRGVASEVDLDVVYEVLPIGPRSGDDPLEGKPDPRLSPWEIESGVEPSEADAT